jgi:putative transposase
VSRHRFIATEKANYPVALLCRVLKVASNGYFAWRQRRPSRPSQANASLIDPIRAIHGCGRSTLRTTPEAC